MPKKLSLENIVIELKDPSGNMDIKTFNVISDPTFFYALAGGNSGSSGTNKVIIRYGGKVFVEEPKPSGIKENKHPFDPDILIDPINDNILEPSERPEDPMDGSNTIKDPITVTEEDIVAFLKMVKIKIGDKYVRIEKREDRDGKKEPSYKDCVDPQDSIDASKIEMVNMSEKVLKLSRENMECFYEDLGNMVKGGMGCEEIHFKSYDTGEMFVIKIV
jgi:hypothetical protein